MKNLLYGKKDNHKERKLLPLNAEIASPSTYWQQTWRYDKLKGLGPELTTFLLKGGEYCPVKLGYQYYFQKCHLSANSIITQEPGFLKLLSTPYLAGQEIRKLLSS